MKEEQDYIQDITEIRSMMERSSKFLSLSGWAGIMAGIYALVGVWIANYVYGFNPNELFYTSPNLPNVIMLAFFVLILALATAIYFSWKKSQQRSENIWNATSRRLLTDMALPLVTGGILILFLISKGLIGLIAPLTLLFYGLALYNAGTYTIFEVRFMGIIQVILGLMSSWFIAYGLIFWAIGFGVIHMIYGVYMHFRYER
jgi:hypothetical protein